MSSSSPWDGLTTPSTPNEVNILRVDVDHPWGIYWGRNAHRYLLIVRLKERVLYTGKLPGFKGLRVSLDRAPSGGTQTLMLELLDNRADDIFQLLCQDIIEATREAPSEQELVREIISRTWMWHRFLQKGRSGLLTAQEQQGLIGELSVLEQFCIPLFGAGAAVAGWTGPVGTARDFEYGAKCLEVKAKRAPALPFVEINSEFQLDNHGLESLFLLVVDVTSSSNSGGKSLNTIVDSLRASLALDGDALDLLDERLTAAGYLGQDDYSEWLWSTGDIQFFSVEGDFPSIRHSMLTGGISNVEYRLSLQQCQSFEVDSDYVALGLKGPSNG